MMANEYSRRLSEVAPPRSGGVAEQRRPRRDSLTERIMRLDLDDLANRATPLSLPPGVTIERCLDYFLRVRFCEHFDLWEPGWDKDNRFQGGR